MSQRYENLKIVSMMLSIHNIFDAEFEVNRMRGNGRDGFIKIVMNVHSGLFCVTG